MGLLDTGDPEKDAALYRGLLTAGLQLMQSRGKFLPALGQGGLAGLGGFEHERNRQLAAKRIGLQDELLKGQSERQKQQSALDQIAGQYIKPDQQGNNPSSFVPGSMDLPGLIKAFMAAPGGLQTGLGLQAALQKQEPKLESIAPGALGGYFKDGKFVEVARNPKEDADKVSPIAQLIAERDRLPIGDPTRRIFDDAIRKASTHQEPISVNNYGTPLPIKLPGGGEGYLQPPSRPGGPTQVLTIPGTGKPAQKPGEEGKATTEAERTAGFLLQRIRDSQRQLSAAILKDPTAARPSVAPEVARKVGEPIANTITSPARQRVESAQLDILDAALTLGTGAAYTREQLEGYRKSYFPQLGDSKEAVKDKADRLNNLIRAAETKAGKAAADKGKTGGWSIERE